MEAFSGIIPFLSFLLSCYVAKTIGNLVVSGFCIHHNVCVSPAVRNVNFFCSLLGRERRKALGNSKWKKNVSVRHRTRVFSSTEENIRVVSVRTCVYFISIYVYLYLGLWRTLSSRSGEYRGKYLHPYFQKGRHKRSQVCLMGVFSCQDPPWNVYFDEICVCLRKIINIALQIYHGR